MDAVGKNRRTFQLIFRYTILIIVGIIMIYPLLWMVSATFKVNSEIFSGIGLIPKSPTQ